MLQRHFRVTDIAGVQNRNCAIQAHDHRLWPATIRSPGLPFDGIHPRNSRNYMAYYSFTDPGGM